MLRKAKKVEIAEEKPVVVLIHGAYWLIYLLLLTVIFSVVTIQAAKTTPRLPALFPLVVLSVAPNLISFYLSYGWLFSRFLVRRKILALSGFGAAVCLLSAFSGVGLAFAFFGSGKPMFTSTREFLATMATFFVVAAIHAAIALVIHGFIRWYEEIKLKEELARRNFEIELALIKSQINPHFLFNTINNIDVLITRDAARASRCLNRLSDVLRYMVYETKSEKIPLEREIDYLEKYLELQKIRTTNPDYVKIEILGNAGARTIAPMLFFPFIENAFKHTENRKNAGSIRVKIAIEKDRLLFECENSHHETSDRRQDFGGVGNALVKRRLSLLYPDKHLLEIADEDGVYRVKLTLYEN